MPNPSPQAIALIRSFVSDWSPDDATIAVALNTPSIANPSVQPTVARPFVTRDLMGTLDVAALGRIASFPSLPRLLDDITLQEPGRLDNWVVLLTAAGTITQPQAAALEAVVHATQPDPAYRPSISWAEVNLGRLADADDITAARPEV